MAKDQKGDEAEVKDKDTGINYQDFGQAGNRAGDFKTKTDGDFHQAGTEPRAGGEGGELGNTQVLILPTS